MDEENRLRERAAELGKTASRDCWTRMSGCGWEAAAEQAR